jgi:hypothetical protein
MGKKIFPYSKLWGNKFVPFEEYIGLRKREEKITVLIEATTFATQPACNAAWAAHTLSSDQKPKIKLVEIQVVKCNWHYYK